jgi:hypothetical protein
MENTRSKILVLAFARTVAVALSALVTTVLLGNDAEAEESVSYSTSDAGQTYGTVLDVTFPKTPLPELLAAVATNGKEGYIYVSDCFLSREIPQKGVRTKSWT